MLLRSLVALKKTLHSQPLENIVPVNFDELGKAVITEITAAS